MELYQGDDAELAHVWLRLYSAVTNAQLMTVTPYIAGAISAVFFSILSDSFYWRMPFVAIPPGPYNNRICHNPLL